MAKVFVALSGGVDSSVAALLLQNQGYEVSCVFMRFWADPRFGSWNRCCSLDSERRARAVALKLGVPFFVFDFKKEFKKEVVDYFLKQIKAGLTTNPCVVCNEKIKLGLFLNKALKLGADYVATGHYARLGNIISSPLDISFALFRAKDKNKDQSYFLWKLNQKQLAKILFPIGEYTKTEVRVLAKKHRLLTAKIKESQNLCFLSTDPNDFLKSNLTLKPGKIIDTKGKIIGKHFGLGFFTIGQRQGIGPNLFLKEQSHGPFYVLKKDLKKNILIVTRKEKDLFKKELIATEINWISGKAPKLPLKAKVKIRSQQKEVFAIIGHRMSNGHAMSVKFINPQRAITPGQSIVFYKGKELLGGGIIL